MRSEFMKESLEITIIKQKRFDDAVLVEPKEKAKQQNE